ncbi:MAG: tetratricopeptide repeat protein [Candidatus Rifleibacteriota bacterium]
MLRHLLLAILLLVCAFSCQVYSPAFFADPSTAMLTRLVPETLRGFVAARLWEQADRYMHSGPSRIEKDKFVAGSYAGNTDLLPLLRAVTVLVPKENRPWQLLATNLGRYLGDKEQAIRLLQEAIRLNRNSSEIHELYAAVASIKMFAGRPDREEKRSAIKYLNEAIKTFVLSTKAYDDRVPGLNLQAYFILRSRLELEIGYPRSALESWEKSGLPLVQEQGRLASMLLAFRDRGIFPDPNEFSKHADIPDKPVEAALSLTSGELPAVSALPLAKRSRFSLLASLLLLVAAGVFRQLFLKINQ